MLTKSYTEFRSRIYISKTTRYNPFIFLHTWTKGIMFWFGEMTACIKGDACMYVGISIKSKFKLCIHAITQQLFTYTVYLCSKIHVCRPGQKAKLWPSTGHELHL